MATASERISNFLDVVKDYTENIHSMYFSDDEKDIVIKTIDADGNVTEQTVPNKAKIIKEFKDSIAQLNMKIDEDGQLVDNNGLPVTVNALAGKTGEQWSKEVNTANRYAVYPYTKQSYNGVGNTNIIFQSMDLSTIFITGLNDNGYLIPNYGNNIVRGVFGMRSPNAGVPLKKIVYAGADTPILLFEDGKLYGWGHNGKGQLGLGTSNVYTLPVLLSTDVNDVESSTCGDNWDDGSLYVIKTDGSLWVAGDNADGELGLGDTDNRNTLTKSFDPDDYDGAKVIKVRNSGTNGNTAVILTDAGKIYTAGYNNNGMCGSGNTNTQKSWYSPSVNDDNFFIDVNITQVWDNAYGVSTYAITNDGKVFAVGDNDYGELGRDSDTDYETTFAEIVYPDGYDADSDPFIRVETTLCAAFIFTKNGLLYSCGNNEYGQLGLGDTDNRNVFTYVTDGVKDIITPKGINSSLYRYVFIIKINGEIYGIGHNSYGRLGVGHNSDCHAPAKVLLNEPERVTAIRTSSNDSRNTTYFVYDDGKVYSCGDSYYAQDKFTSSVGIDTNNVIPQLAN
jgi:alpha-tubulin suppressor-like RCC1 family protein